MRQNCISIGTEISVTNNFSGQIKASFGGEICAGQSVSQAKWIIFHIDENDIWQQCRDLHGIDIRARRHSTPVTFTIQIIVNLLNLRITIPEKIKGSILGHCTHSKKLQ